MLAKLRTRLGVYHYIVQSYSINWSAYADDVMVLINSQKDIDNLVSVVKDFDLISSARVNWEKSDAWQLENGRRFAKVAWSD